MTQIAAEKIVRLTISIEGSEAWRIISDFCRDDI